MEQNKIGTVKVEQAPITSLTVTAPDIIYCDDLTATATADTINGAAAVTYKWYLDGRELTDQTGATLTLSDDEYRKAGTYTIKCAASSDNYTVIKETTVTVNPADLKDASLSISGEDRLIYSPVNSDKDSGKLQYIRYNLRYKDKVLSKGDYTANGNANIRFAGIYTLTVTGQGNYTGTKSIDYEVRPCPIIDLRLGNIEKVYDGTPDVPSVLLDEAYFTPDTGRSEIRMERGTDYTINAQYDSTEVGDRKTVIVRVRMLNNNFSFEGGQREREFVIPWKTGSARQSIDKATVTPQPAHLAVINGHEKTYTVDLTKLLPELTAPQKYGDITYGTPVVTLNGYYDDSTNGAKIENGILSLPIEKVDTDAEGDIGTVTVVVSTTNYEDMTLTINVKASNKLVPVGEPTLSKAALTYGEKLGNITLSGSMKYENATVEGTFAWVTPDAKPDVTAAYKAEWIFTPTDNVTYAKVNGTTQIPVNKATPQVTELPIVAVQTYNPSKVLSDSDLTGGKATDVNGNLLAGTWSWQSTGIIPTVDNKGYTAVFTPDDSANYEQATRTITVKVTKATPVIVDKPVASEITYGDSLGKSALAGGTVKYSDSDDTAVAVAFTWKDAAIQPVVADSNSKEFTVIFTPADTANYEAAETNITINVRKAPTAPNMPGNAMNVSNGTKKVSEISLPENWIWQDADKDTPLEVDKAVKATAFYSGADKGNYETESVEISITRSDCDHKNTEIRNAKEATCEHTGYTGDTYCKECAVKLTGGTATAALGHNYVGKVTKEPTTSSTGIRTYTCSRCGASYTTAIAKLQDNTNREQKPVQDTGMNNHQESKPEEKQKTELKNKPQNQSESKPQSQSDGKPFMKGDSEKSGWQMILEQIEQAKEGDTVEIDMNGTTTVPSDIFEQVKGKDIQIVFQMGDGISWTINGKDVADVKGDIDLGVTVGNDAGKSIPVDIVNQITGEHYSMNVTLAYSGEFGFIATLTINMEEKNAGYYANLFYYNPDSSQLEFMCAGEIGEDGNVNLTFTHASDYSIVISDTIIDSEDTVTKPEESTGQDEGTPASGDNTQSTESHDNAWKGWWVILIGSIAIIIGLGIFFVEKQKKQNHKE